MRLCLRKLAWIFITISCAVASLVPSIWVKTTSTAGDTYDSKGEGSKEEGSTTRGRLGKVASTSTAAAALQDGSGRVLTGNSTGIGYSARELEVASRAPQLELDELDDEQPFEDPPSVNDGIPDQWIQRCSRYNGSTFEHGAVCGPPLSKPCFDHSMCTSGTLPKMYVFDMECSLADSSKLRITDHSELDRQHQSSYWREAVWRAGMLAERYEEACLFIHVSTHTHDEPCATRTPRWNGGVNHIMMDFTPWWTTSSRHPSISNTYAMEWSFDALSCHYRSGFDLALPLVPGKSFPEMAPSPAPSRQYFLTFKGTLYLTGYGLEERSAATRVYDPSNGIVTVTTCATNHGEEKLPENRDYCERSKRRYDRYDYVQLMNTTFALVPSGRSPGTFRLGEVMSAGAIPVFVVRDWIKPFQEQIDWPSFSFTFSPDDVGPTMVELLRAVEPAELMEMQRKSLEAYWKIFGGVTDYSVIAANSIDVLIRRVGYH